MNKVQCYITKKTISINEAYRGDLLRKEIFKLIQNDHPDFNASSYISVSELEKYRRRYLANLINKETEELDELDKEVLDAVSTHKILSENIEFEIDKKLTFGEKMADAVSNFGGSWLFISMFFIFIIFWVCLNIILLETNSFDPYPFVFLNVILSCLAAIQAPIILMSQNRTEAKDRKRGEYDYQVDLKAELEIRLLNEKLDHITLHQNKKILEILELQADYLEDIMEIININQASKK